MDTTILGIISALLAPLLITLGLALWAELWKGHAVALNLFKCTAASIMYIITILIVVAIRKIISSLEIDSGSDSDDSNKNDNPWEDWIRFQQDQEDQNNPTFTNTFFIIIISGTIGITIGDNLWLTALQLLGARRLVLVDSLKPFMATLFGIIFLDEFSNSNGGSSTVLENIGFLIGLSLTSLGIFITGREVGSESDAESRYTQSGELESDVNSESKTNLQIDDIDLQDSVQQKIQNSDEILIESNHASAAKCELNQNINKAKAQIIGTQTDQVEVQDIEIIENEKSNQDLVLHTSRDCPTQVTETPQQETQSKYPQHLKSGYIMAFLNCLLDVYGSVLVKKHAQHWHPLLVNLVRFGIAAVTIGILAGIARRWYSQTVHDDTSNMSANHGDKSQWYLCPSDLEMAISKSNDQRQKDQESDSDSPQQSQTFFQVLRQPHYITIIFAVFFVTFLGPTLATYGLFQLPLSINVTLTSVGPLYSIPVVYLVRGERVSKIGWLGAILTVMGVGVLCGTME